MDEENIRRAIAGAKARWAIPGAMARWAVGMGAAIVLAGVSVLGVTLSGASGGGTAQAAGAVLTGSGASASNGGSPSGSGPGAAAMAGATGFAASSGSAATWGVMGGARARQGWTRLARLIEIARHAMHGQVTVATRKGPKTIAFERGTVQSVSGSAVVVKAADGVTWTWQVGSETRLFRAGHRVAATTLASGERVAVIGLVTGGTDQARRVVIRDHATRRP